MVDEYREVEPQDSVTVSGTVAVSSVAGTVTTAPETPLTSALDSDYSVGADAGIGLAAGLLSNVSVMHKFGHNPDIDQNSVPEDIWDVGGMYSFPTSAIAMEAVSSSANDVNTTGTGAWTVYVEGLDSNWDYQSETVNLNGTSAVALANNYLRVFRAYITGMGTDSSESNLGDIDIQGSGGGTVYARIATGIGQTEMAIYTVPAGKTAYISRLHASTQKGSSADAQMAILVRDSTTGTNPFVRFKLSFSISNEASYEHPWIPPLPVEEKRDIMIRANEVNNNNTVVDAGFTCILIDN